MVTGIILIFALRSYLLIGVSTAGLGLLLFLIFGFINRGLKKKIAK